MTKVAAGQHLKELRMRLFIVAIFFIAGACLAYSFQTPVIDAVLAPLKGQKLVYLNPAGGFSFIFMISVYAGLALALPVLIQQLYLFVRPALPLHAQKKSASIIVGGFLLLAAGIAFGYFVAVPNALIFLYSFADQFIDASLTADSYLNFVIAYTIGIGMVFQIPLLLLLVNTIKPFTPSGLMKSERWVILASFIVAAIITPTPDPINQTIIAGPVIIVYQIGVIIILNSIYKKRRITKRLAKKALVSERRLQKAEAKQKTAPSYTPKAAVPHTPVPQPIARPIYQTTQTQRTRSVDGFVRPTQQRVTVPTRVQPQQPTIRHAARPVSSTQRQFSTDGIYRPFRQQVSTPQ